MYRLYMKGEFVMSAVSNDITIYVENPETKQVTSMLFSIHEDGSSTLKEGVDESTKNFTIMSSETNLIASLVKDSGSVFEVLANGYITEQEKCEVFIRGKENDVTPLGEITKDIPLEIGGIVIGFKCEVARSGDHPSSYVSDKFYGRIVAIDAR